MATKKKASETKPPRQQRKASERTVVVSPEALEQVRVYRVVDSHIQLKASDAPVTNLNDTTLFRKRDEVVTSLDFETPALEERYAKVHEKSKVHGIELLYKTSRAEWEKEQAGKQVA